jgi:preprotein translocase subunit SecD
MDRNLRWRTLGLVGVLVLCACILLPSLVPGLPSWFTAVFENKINLGIDIDGGARVVYSIDLDRAVDDKASEIKRDLEAKFAEGEWKGKVTLSAPATPVGAVTLKTTDAAKRDELKKLVIADYADVVIERPCAPGDGDGAICFRVSSDYAANIRLTALRSAVNTVRERLDETGVAEPSVVEKGDDIIVELPGLDDEAIQNIRSTIARTAKLEFKVVDNDSAFMRDLHAHVTSDAAATAAGIQADTDTWPVDNAQPQRDYFLFASDRNESITVEEAKKTGCWNKKMTPSADGKVECNLSGRYVIERYLHAAAEQDARFKIPDDRQMGFEKVAADAASSGTEYWRTWFLNRAVRLSGTSISEAVVSFDPNTTKPIVLVDFNRYGSRVFGDLTSQNVGKRMAIILDDKVTSAPVINGPILGGRASITMGSGSTEQVEKEATILVAVLKTGSLPAPLREESASQVGPTLGRDAVDKAKFAFGLGVVFVVGLLFYIYRASGLIALITLSLNVLFVLTVLTGFGATLTLPGIAGIVLTFGMSVDGNIIIFERIREELLAGKSVRGAVDTGFGRAFGAILDGQLTTMAGGFVLLVYGSGPIVGFAVTLIIGNVTALFANIWCTRVLYDHYLNFVRARNGSLSI